MAQKTEKSFETHQGKKPNQKLKPCLGTPQNDLPRLQVHIPILNVSNSCSAAAAVQKKVHDHPCPILTKAAVPRWLLQEPLQLFIGVSLFHRFLFLHVGECQSRDPLRIAPIKKSAELAHIGCNRVVCQSCLSHGNYHLIQHLFCQRIKRRGDVEIQRNVVEVLMVIADGHIRYPLCGFRGYKRGVNLFKCLPAVLAHRDLFSHKNRPHPSAKFAN